jgi:hypothetical protein
MLRLPGCRKEMTSAIRLATSGIVAVPPVFRGGGLPTVWPCEFLQGRRPTIAFPSRETRLGCRLIGGNTAIMCRFRRDAARKCRCLRPCCCAVPRRRTVIRARRFELFGGMVT